MPLCNKWLQEMIELRLSWVLVRACSSVARIVCMLAHSDNKPKYTYIIMKSTEEYRVRVYPSAAVAIAIALIFCSIAPKIVLKNQ